MTRLSTRTNVVEIPTRRGVIRVGPNGTLDGLWPVIRKELRSNAQVRKMAGGITRHTLIKWRANGFPAPVIVLGDPPVEYWSRTAVEDHLEARA